MGKLSTHQRRARNFVQRAEWDSALAEMRQAMASDPNNPTTHNQMGDLFLRKDEIENACEHFQKAIDLYAQLGLHNNAVALCRKVMRLAPSRIEVRYSLARLRFDQGLRADGVAAANDYLDNAPTQGEDAIAVLEERCRALVDAFPDAAPVGKILEKLESAHLFPCAFEIVQRLAQRAADAGDDGAAAKYTEKMRSLKVLVEGSGGGDILSEGQAPSPGAATSSLMTSTEADAAPAVIEIDTVSAPPVIEIDADSAPPMIEIDADAPAPVVEIEPESRPPVIEMDAESTPPVVEIDLDAPTPVVEIDAASALPRLELDADDPLREFGPNITPPTPAASTSGPLSFPAVPPESELPTAEAPDVFSAPSTSAVPEAAASSTPASLDDLLQDPGGPGSGDEQSAAATAEPAASEPEDAAADASLGPPEYELPEASLQDIAEILEDEPMPQGLPEGDASPDTPSTPAAPEPPGAAPNAGFALGASSLPPAAPAASPDAVPSAPTNPVPSVPPDVPPESSPSAAPDDASAHVRPSQQLPRPSQPMRRPAGGPPSGELREPVWIPDASADPTAMPDPSSGQMHQLEDVIETFRDQMAKALGNDASARYDLGVAYYEMGLYNEALTEFEAAVQDAHYREQCLEMMAACLAMQGRHAEIVEMLTPLIEASEANVGLGLRYTMGVACETLGLREDARHHFEQVARVDSTYRDVQARLKLY